MLVESFVQEIHPLSLTEQPRVSRKVRNFQFFVLPIFQSCKTKYSNDSKNIEDNLTKTKFPTDTLIREPELAFLKKSGLEC